MMFNNRVNTENNPINSKSIDSYVYLYTICILECLITVYFIVQENFKS